MGLADPLDSSPAYGFIVTIDGVELPKVVDVSGLKSEVDKIELKQQTKDGKYVVRQLIGRVVTTITAIPSAGHRVDYVRVIAHGLLAHVDSVGTADQSGGVTTTLAYQLPRDRTGTLSLTVTPGPLARKTELSPRNSLPSEAVT